MRVVRILHVFKDQKFFDSFSDKYDNIPSFQNLYYFYTSNKNYEFKYIKNKWKIIVIHNRSEYLKLFSSKDIDVILFHSFSEKFYSLFKYIDKEKIVIWWSWGGDIYNKNYNVLPPLIKCELYKPITKMYIKEHDNISFKVAVKRLLYPYYLFMRNRAIRRTDFFIPCMPIDYELLNKHCSYFRAGQFPAGSLDVNFEFVLHDIPGNILIGNSLTYTNNHLDIFEILQKYNLDLGRKYIIPVSYGWGNSFNSNPNNLISLCKLDPNLLIWLKDYLDRSDYFKMFDSVTHAIFGVIRQQALGNIYACLRRGVKVYLYKDSVVARQLQEYGFKFYTIEDDLSEFSLSECLSKKDALINFNTEKKRRESDSISSLECTMHKILHD